MQAVKEQQNRHTVTSKEQPQKRLENTLTPHLLLSAPLDWSQCSSTYLLVYTWPNHPSVQHNSMSLGYAERLSFREDVGGRLGDPEILEAAQEVLQKVEQFTDLVRPT
jgi:hypothetical protein